MAKWSNDSGLDAALTWFKDCDIMHLCKSQPANYAALATTTLGSVAMVPGDFTLADGDTSGRKVTIAAKTISAASGSDAGTTLHAALAKTGDTTLRYVTTIPTQAITSGNPLQIGAWKIEISDPS